MKVPEPRYLGTWAKKTANPDMQAIRSMAAQSMYLGLGT